MQIEDPDKTWKKKLMGTIVSSILFTLFVFNKRRASDTLITYLSMTSYVPY
jgi:hypothetical protein